MPGPARGDSFPFVASEIIDSVRSENGVLSTGPRQTSRRLTKRPFFAQVSLLPFDLGGWRFYRSYGSCRVPFRRSRASPPRSTGLVFSKPAASLDHGPSTDFLAHRLLSGADIPGLENVANLDRLPPRGPTVIALPMKIENGTGAPAPSSPCCHSAGL